MSRFLADLFTSIFTPGPTPSLIVATNAAFASLQIVLLILLTATYSVHFLVLSFLSAGLWWAINWFSTELKAGQALEDAKKNAGSVDNRPVDGSDTEAETVIETSGGLGSKRIGKVDNPGELKLRGSTHEGKSETSTEDEWERVSENEKDK
jgi:hypothetical protein